MDFFVEGQGQSQSSRVTDDFRFKFTLSLYNSDLCRYNS